MMHHQQGLLSHPVKNYPSLFGRGGPLTDFLTEFPYFLPCFISGCICAVGLIFGIFFLEETLGGTASSKTSKTKNSETAPLLRSDSHHSDEYNTFDRSSSPTPTITDDDHDDKKKPSLRESLTPAVLGICFSYALFAFQAIYYDGKKRGLHNDVRAGKIELTHSIRTLPYLDSKRALEWWSWLPIG